jgi:nicotinate-nucleotide pyrophosphorylase (carboxylating)
MDLSSIVRSALAEDIGSGDVSADFFLPEERGIGRFRAKQDGVLSGSDAAAEVFHQLESSADFTFPFPDGSRFKAGDILGTIKAPLSVLLTGERTALNFLQHMCGIATITRQFLTLLGRDSRIGIYDTRKTTPGLRLLEKKAVADGGGKNYRMGLYDMAMLKNNHIDAAGGVAEAVARLRRSAAFQRKPGLPICVEARNVQEAISAIQAEVEIVMLDNMAPSEIRETVGEMKQAARQSGVKLPQIEVSGGVTLSRIAEYRDLPIQRISVGAITHSAPAIDISMQIAREA